MLVGVDVFVGVSSGGLLCADDIRTMADQPIVFPMANPTPEISPDGAFKGGAAVVGTGRSDYPNQINSVLAFPGIFRGALDVKARSLVPLAGACCRHHWTEQFPRSSQRLSAGLLAKTNA
jgi:malate dehydrogenase (oxaloacetate-decarboxylating)